MKEQETLQDKWIEVRERIASKWGKFTKLEIDSVRNNLDGLVEIIQNVYGYRRAHAERECHDFRISLRPVYLHRDHRPGDRK